MIVSKISNKRAPKVFEEYFKSNFDVHQINTRSRNKLRPPLRKSEVMKHSIKVTGAYIWNYVSTKIDSEQNFKSFKTSLRKFLSGNSDLINIVL